MNSKNSTEILEAMKIAIPIFAEHKNSEWHELEEALVKAGILPLLATKLTEFMPLAFGRVFMDGIEVKFDDYYIRHDPETKRELRMKFDDEPVYQDAFELASHIIATNRNGEAFNSIAFRSIEVQNINDLLKQGSKLKRIYSLPPLLWWNEECEKQFNSSRTK